MMDLVNFIKFNILNLNTIIRFLLKSFWAFAGGSSIFFLSNKFARIWRIIERLPSNISNALMGKSIPTDDLIITKDINAILVIEDNFTRSLPCISCGKCLEVCPVGIYPAFIMKNISNIKELECLKADECIECGLCSYICPSKIEVREFVKAAKEKVNNKWESLR